MKLYLMRHGEAEGIYDNEEPRLSARGEAEVNRIVNALSSMEIRLDHIYHSGKLRARQTAEMVGSKLGVDILISEKEGMKPNDPVSIFAGNLKDNNENSLIVGHLPFMAKLTSCLLADTESDSMIAFSTASVACLEYTNPFGWNLHWLINPENFVSDK
ncbi:MAG: phosphohistidine phosphatase SixA [Candidatus Marinimicrobia bacterium]|nr:phosphohistidine phosphatase SixA [Candidatus Neomarinimicrobiota bacterium]